MADTDTIGQFSTCVPPAPSWYDAEYLERELNEIKANINTLAQAVWLLTYGTAVADRTNPGVTEKTVPYTVAPLTDAGFRFSNLGATAVVSFFLPPATTDQEYEFSRDANFDILVVPQVGERHLLGTASQAMRITTLGDLVRLGCADTGIWRILRLVGSTPAYNGALLAEDNEYLLTEDGNVILVE
jgi:hypothetical protein